MKNKLFANAHDAIQDISDGAVIMAGGFGLCGNPENLIHALHVKGCKRLTVISNNCGTDRQGLGLLLEKRQIQKMIMSYVGENKTLEQLFLKGEIEIELVPQGTLAEKIRCGGAGIPAFFTPTGYGTYVAEGGLPMLHNPQGKVIKVSATKECREFNGRGYVLETSLRAHFALIKAWKGDTSGNLIYRKTARNFNPVMATAADLTIAEVEELVPTGELDPDQIHTPGIFVHRIFQGENYHKPIEKRTVRSRDLNERELLCR